MRRERLAEHQLAGGLVEGGQVGEGAADVDGDAQTPLVLDASWLPWCFLPAVHSSDS